MMNMPRGVGRCDLWQLKGSTEYYNLKVNPKKHTIVSYLRVQKATAAGIIHITKEGTKFNLADMSFKSWPETALHELSKLKFY